jgi:hypothetical protein
MNKVDSALRGPHTVSLRRSRSFNQGSRRVVLAGRFSIFLLLLVCLCPSFGSAQVSATLSGIVTDQAGAAVSAASVTARNLDTGLSRDTVTDQAGRYQLFALPLGQYEVRVKKDGFAEAIRTFVW